MNHPTIVAVHVNPKSRYFAVGIHHGERAKYNSKLAAKITKAKYSEKKHGHIKVRTSFIGELIDDGFVGWQDFARFRLNSDTSPEDAVKALVDEMTKKGWSFVNDRYSKIIG